MPDPASLTPVAESLSNSAPGVFATWLPVIIMITGIVVLGSLLMVMFHRRERQMKALAAQIASDLEEARALRQQLDEAHQRAANMMASVQRLSARLDERVASLDMASLRMSAVRNALPRPNAIEPAVAQSPRPIQVAAGDIKTQAVRPASVATIEGKPGADAITRRIYELADAGQPALSIARDLNEQVGKVELILALRGR